MINWKKEGMATTVVAHMFTGMILIGALMSILIMSIIPKSPVLYITLLFVLLFLSISFLIYSKIPSILSGKYYKFGIKNIVEERKKYYKASYLLLVISALLAISIVQSIKFFGM